MGNCSGKRSRNDRLNMQSKEQLKMKVGSLRKCNSDHPINSPISDNGDAISKSTRSTGIVPCKIPILKDNFASNSQLPRSKGSYKSVLFDRPNTSRIPVTNNTIEYHKAIPVAANDGELDNSQYNESGFASDLSVTTSSFSQVITDTKSTDTVIDDRSNVSSTRNNKLPNKPTYLNIQNQGKASIINVVNACASTVGPLTPDMVSVRQSTSSTKSISTYNIENKYRRPQSISTETEAILNMSLSKRRSEGSEILSPCVTMHEHSAVMQDVSSLKLMLHKLKRCLTQDGDEKYPDINNDCSFRLCSPSVINIKSLTREELEQKYELLRDTNVNLEKLLQSRERVIAKLQTEKLQQCDGPRATVLLDQRAHGDHNDNSPADALPYHWSNLKLPHSHS